MKQQIIAMGGGGFSMEPDNLALDRYVLDQVDSASPRVCFLPTASAESDEYLVKFYSAYTRLGAVPSHLSLFRLPTSDLAGFILSQDVIYVGGGNTRSMLALWREWGLDNILRTALEQGVVLAGISAGAICWFEQGITDSIPGKLSVLQSLGFLPGSCCPHYDGEETRRPAYQQFIRTGEALPGYGADNSAALHFVDGRLLRCVRSQPGANVYHVENAAGEVQEQALEIEDLECCPPSAPGSVVR